MIYSRPLLRDTFEVSLLHPSIGNQTFDLTDTYLWSLPRDYDAISISSMPFCQYPFHRNCRFIEIAVSSKYQFHRNRHLKWISMTLHFVEMASTKGISTIWISTKRPASKPNICSSYLECLEQKNVST